MVYYVGDIVKRNLASDTVGRIVSVPKNKATFIIAVIVTFVAGGASGLTLKSLLHEGGMGYALNMANTVHPIISKIGRSACGYENIQFRIGDNDEWAKGSELIYKREPIATGQYDPGGSCISDTGNVYYIRCVDWKWMKKGSGMVLYKRPTHDVPLGVYSCIDEEDVEIPYHDRMLQEAGLGVAYPATGQNF